MMKYDYYEERIVRKNKTNSLEKKIMKEEK
jgi:hypothetical protein